MTNNMGTATIATVSHVYFVARVSDGKTADFLGTTEDRAKAFRIAELMGEDYGVGSWVRRTN